MDLSFAVEKAKAYSKLVNAFIDVDRIILFGSHVHGHSREYSDIDIAIVVKKLKKDFFEIEPELWRLRRKVDPLIEPVLIEEENDPAGFLDEISKTGILIYQSGNSNLKG